MLLLVVNPELHQPEQLFIHAWRHPQRLQALIDAGAIGQHYVQPWAREQSPLRTRVFVAHGVVIGVKQHAKDRVERLETRLPTL